MVQVASKNTSVFLKAIFALQVLILLLFAYAFFGSSTQQTAYRESEAAYRKAAADYKLMRDKYAAELETWQKSMSQYQEARPGGGGGTGGETRGENGRK